MTNFARSRFGLVFLGTTIFLATLLTGFYFAHEQLPRVLRAPTAFLLAPVAVVDGICYATGIRGIYGQPIAVFAVNFVSAAALSALAIFVASVWRKRRH